MKRVSDVFRGRAFPEVERKELPAVFNREIILHDFTIRCNKYGFYTFILFSFPEDLSANPRRYSVACGGEGIVSTLLVYRKNKVFPISGRITWDYDHYDLI